MKQVLLQAPVNYRGWYIGHSGLQNEIRLQMKKSVDEIQFCIWDFPVNKSFVSHGRFGLIWFIVSYDSANKQKYHKSHRVQ